MTFEVPVTQARAQLADLVNRVVYGGERVVLTRHGKPIVAMVPADELARLDEAAEAAQARSAAQVVRLGAERPPSGPGPLRGHHLDAAAEHRPFGSDPS